MRELIESLADEACGDNEDWNELNADGVSLRDWYVAVEMAVYEAVSITASDLPDWMWHDAWADCRDPEECARELLHENGLGEED